MHVNRALSKGRPRHFDRGQRLRIGWPAALLLAACSSSLGSGQTGSAGTGSGTGGVAGTSAGGTSGGGTGGVAGTSAGGRGGGGTGGVAGTSAGGSGGGTGGTGGESNLPACTTGTPSFSVCFVSDADVLPLPTQEVWQAPVMSAAMVEAVGTGTAPARCADARVFGAARSSERWLQVRTPDNRLWTIGFAGLANVPMYQVGDAVNLHIDYRRYIGQAGAAPYGVVQLSDTAGTPLVLAGNNVYSLPWLSLVRMNDPVCGMTAGICQRTRYEVTATVNGISTAVAPFSTVSIGGYTLAVGEYVTLWRISAGSSGCSPSDTPPLAVAAVKDTVSADAGSPSSAR